MSSPIAASNTRQLGPSGAISVDDVNFYFFPGLQTLASMLALINALVALALGICFLFFPQWILSLLLGYHVSEGFETYHSVVNLIWMMQDDGAKFAVMMKCVARMAGGVMSAQALACFLLLYPSFTEGPLFVIAAQQRYSKMAVWNVRICIAIQSMTGLCWFLVGLLNDERNSINDDVHSNDHRTTFWLLIVGFVILSLSCISLMLSFWPSLVVTDPEWAAVSSRGDNEFEQTVLTSSRVASNTHTNEELTTPLLVTIQSEARNGETRGENQAEVDAELLRHSEQDHEEESVERVPEDGNNSAEDETTPTSRIRGTRRLLKLAASQVVYLWIGCITLLIRLPFSLCIPHFVAMTLEALGKQDFERARKEVCWLFALGTVDAL
jgi:hypothetical protein